MKILISSLKFGVGHVAHLRAYMQLVKSCGYEAAAFVNGRYIEFLDRTSCEFFDNREQIKLFSPDVAIIYNTGFEDINFLKFCKSEHIKTIFVLHEPYMGIRELLKDGDYCVKEAVGSMLNSYLCSKADLVFLSSKYAIENCKKYMPRAYKKSAEFPLIFQDSFLMKGKRKYFSLIGGYAYSHGSDIFLDFIKKSYRTNNILFQIATRNNIEEQLNDPIIKKMIESERLVVKQGKALSSEEIDAAYRSSICTWNGYRRSTQSGVLANSYMQGTPVIATNVGSFNEYVSDGKTGKIIGNFEYETLLNSYLEVSNNIETMEKCCRDAFKTYFFYANQKDIFTKIMTQFMRDSI